MSYLRTYYRFEEQGPLRKEHMENCFRAEDPKKFKEFLEWKEEMERIHPYGRDAIESRKKFNFVLEGIISHRIYLTFWSLK